MFKIKCEVWGGVTGHRVGMLRDTDGSEKEFATRGAAEKEAAKLMEHATDLAKRKPDGPRYKYEAIEVTS